MIPSLHEIQNERFSKKIALSNSAKHWWLWRYAEPNEKLLPHIMEHGLHMALDRMDCHLDGRPDDRHDGARG